MSTEAARPDPRRRRRPMARYLGVPAALIALMFGCAGPDAGATTDHPEDGSARTGSEILVSAASSLTDAFGEMAAAFEAQNPGVTVRLNLAGSATLRAQILEGAPVDVFASASQAIMEELTLAGQAPETTQLFAQNGLLIVVPADNPGRVTGLSDFSRADLLLGLCAETVPCGILSRQALNRAGVTLALDSSEPDVRALLTKVRLGELDAGIVYLTDVSADDEAVVGIAIPTAFNQTAHYPIAVLTGAPNPVGAQAFVEFLLSPTGRAILARHGFGSA